MLPPQVADYLNLHRKDSLYSLFELLRIPSIANDTSRPDRCMEAAEWVAGRLSGLGFDAEILPTAGRPAVAGDLHVRDTAPTLLVYAHYDVQPAEPLDEWHSPPFEPQLRDGRIYARGASDDKGPLVAYLAAAEAWVRNGGPPVNLRFFVEGEEEVGSPNVEPFVAEHRDRLAADAAVVADTMFFRPGLPSITYGLRGLAYFQITIEGPSRDLHSGLYGGGVVNPANALAGIAASLHDAKGRIAIEGFYDDVVETTDAERESWAALPFDAGEFAAEAGVEALAAGDADVIERVWARPSLDINGIVGGYTQPGSKTIIPARASAKVSIRLAPRQDPQRVVAAFRRHVAAATPVGVRSSVAVHATARPVLVPPDSPGVRAARAALSEAFGTPPEPVLIRCGASVPVTEVLQRLLGVAPVMIGCQSPDDRLHSPNEKYGLDMFERTAVAAAALMQNVARPLQ